MRSGFVCRLLAGCILEAFTSCASMPGKSCGDNEHAAIHDELYFGTQKPGGEVSEADWARFLAEQVTPRFASGFTVWPAYGQWRSASTSIVQEASKVQSVVHDRHTDGDALVRQVVAEYKKQFQQESVLRVRSRICVSF